MRSLYSTVAAMLIVAGLAAFATGAGYLFSEQQSSAIQQNAAGSLATAFFVAGWVCWWVASQTLRARAALGPNRNVRD